VPQNNSHRLRSVRTSALLGIVAVAAIALSIVSYFYFVSVSNDIGDAIRYDLRQHSQNEAFHLAELMENQIQFVANSVDVAINSPSIRSGILEQGAEVMNLAQERTPTLTDSYFWLDASGKTLWSSGFVDNPQEYEQFKGFDFSDRPYFTEVVKTNKPYFSPVSKSPIDHTERMFISYPIIVEGKFQGIVAASIRADTISQAINKELAPAGFDSSLGIVDSQGGVVYSESSELVGENLFGDKVQSVLVPAFESKEKLGEFNQFLKDSISSETDKVNSRDFSAVTGAASTISAAPIIVVESEQAENLIRHQILTLYISTPHDVATKVAPLVDAQRNYSIAIITGIAGAAIMVSYLILSSNKRLERTVSERTLDLKEANERLKDHDKLQTEFINIAAHELRTPVQPLLGAAEALEDQLLAGQGEVKVSRPEVELILRNSKRLAQLTYDILEVSRIESNSLKLHKVQVNLKDKIERVIEDVKPFIGDKELQITLEQKTSEPVTVQADKTKLFEVLSNLLRNAIKFTDKGTIIVVLDKSEREAIIAVVDSGKGIDPDIMPKMFSRFTSKSDSGTGLGLYISKNIVEAHGGRISGDNNSDGIGARFEFTLPLQAAVKTENKKEFSNS
jgi:signal transduction histidine kinase